jgi:hypothetical protein
MHRYVIYVLNHAAYDGFYSFERTLNGDEKLAHCRHFQRHRP